MKTRMLIAAATAFAALGLPAATGIAHADPAPLAGGVSIDLGGAGDTTFVADTYNDGQGLTDTKPSTRVGLGNFANTVSHPIPAAIWNTSRYLESNYSVPGLTPGGSYQVRLYFMDWYFTKVGQRTFHVAIDGSQVLTDFDIIGYASLHGADGGAAFGVEQDFTVIVPASGTVTINFIRGTNNQPQVNAIAIVPSS